MSLDAELESLIADANASLEALESILRRAESRSGQGKEGEVTDGDIKRMRAQVNAARERILTSLIEMRDSYNQDRVRISHLEDELRPDLENIRQCAIDYFLNGQYRECEGLLSFLCKVHPQDEELSQWLVLSRQRKFEAGTQETPRGAAVSTIDSKKLEVAPKDHQSKAQQEQSPEKILTFEGQELPTPTQGESASPVPRNNDEVQALSDDSSTTGMASSVAPKRELQNLADIELRTATQIDETYRALSEPPKSRAWLWLAAAGALLLLTAAFWFAQRRWEIALPLDRTTPQINAAESNVREDPLIGLRADAQRLFDLGKLPEAERVCDEILAKQPQDGFATALKNYIGATSAEFKQQNEENDPPLEKGVEPTREHQPPVPPLDKVHLRKESLPGSAQVGSVKEQSRVSATPETAVVTDLSRESRSAEKPDASPAPLAASSGSTQVATPPQISSEALAEISQRIQARDFDQARLLLENVQKRDAGNSQVKLLRERLSAEMGKVQSMASSWIEKAEAATSAGRYVTPPDDNAVVYCIQALKADPSNQKALSLKKAAVSKASAQAKDWIVEGKYDAARLFYASMEYLAQKDSAFPVPRTDLKQELEELEFRTYSVIHEHKRNGCAGKLRFNGYVVSFLPSGNSGDHFTEPLKSIIVTEEGQRLGIAYRDRSFHFRKEYGDGIRPIYQALIKLMDRQKAVRVSSR